MGDLISLDQHRLVRARDRTRHGRPAGISFLFDAASPYTYLAAERVDRMFGTVRWCPVMADVPCAPISEPAVEQRAAALRLPLVWPERDPAHADGVPRVASFAAASGRCAEFVLAIGRLAFCGGFDLSDPEILAEAIAAAGLPLDESLAAAADRSRDGELRTAARSLMARGADVLPVVSVGRMLFCGEQRLPEAAAASRTALAAPLAHIRS